jgi:hypothetical protein
MEPSSKNCADFAHFQSKLRFLVKMFSKKVIQKPTADHGGTIRRPYS